MKRLRQFVAKSNGFRILGGQGKDNTVKVLTPPQGKDMIENELGLEAVGKPVDIGVWWDFHLLI